MIHPEITKTLVEQRHQELARYQAESRRERYGSAGPGWLSRVPRWHISWSRTVLSPAGASGAASGGRPDRRGKRGSSVVIIISGYRHA